MVENLGVMIDVSRDGVMNVNAFKRYVDYLSKMGYRFIELYSEDIYKVEEEPYLGYLRGPYTKEEIQEMDRYCISKNIELIPCIQTLAHFTSFCGEPKVAHLFDIDDILLVDEPKTYEFIEHIFKFCSEAFTSKKINIGMDEAHHLGQGEYLKKHGLENKNDILLKHLKKVAAIAEKYHYQCHMWGDMFFRSIGGDYYGQTIPDAEIKKIKKSIPKNVSLTCWDYYHINEQDYENSFIINKKLCDNLYFAGGAWTWKGFAPLLDFTLLSMEPALKMANKHQIKNVMITMWGDNGKETSYFSTLPVLYAISEYSKENYDMNSIKEGFFKLFNVKFDTMMLLDLPNTATINGQRRKDWYIPGKFLFYQDPFMGKADFILPKYDFIDYKSIANQLKSAIKETNEFKLIFEEEIKLCEFLSHKAYLGLKTREAYKNKDKKTLKKLLKEYDLSIKTLRAFEPLFNKLWLNENTGFGMEIHNHRLGGLINRLIFCKKRLKEYIDDKISNIPELETELLDRWDNDKFYANSYSGIISSSII